MQQFHKWILSFSFPKFQSYVSFVISHFVLLCCEATLSSVWGRVQFQKINFAGVCDDSQSNSNIMKTHKIGNKSFKSSSWYNENRGVVIVWSGNICGDELIKTAKKDQFGRLIDTKGSHFTVHYCPLSFLLFKWIIYQSWHRHIDYQYPLNFNILQCLSLFSSIIELM